MKKFILIAAFTLSFSAGFAKTTLPNFIDNTNLSITRQDGKVLIQWLNDKDENITMYELEKSEDGENFKTIAYIMTANEIKNYNYRDKISSKNIYYRLKQIDKVGQFTYTSIKVLKDISKNEDVKIAATNNGKISIQLNQQEHKNLVVRLTTLTGEPITEFEIDQPAKKLFLNAPANIKNFVVTVSNSNNLNISKQIVL